MSMYGGILGGGHLLWALSLLVLGGGSGWRIGRSECIACLALEIRRIDVLLLVLVLLWRWTLSVALARSCIAPGNSESITTVTIATDRTPILQ